jgi:hypothetical protein
MIWMTGTVGWCGWRESPFSVCYALIDQPLAYGPHDVWLAGLWVVLFFFIVLASAMRSPALMFWNDFDEDFDVFPVPDELPQ